MDSSIIKELLAKMPKPDFNQVITHPAGGERLIYLSSVKDAGGLPIVTATTEEHMARFAEFSRGAFVRVKVDENGEPNCYLVDAATGVETLMTVGPQDLTPSADYIHQLLFRDRVRIDPVMVYDRSQGSSLNRRYSSTIQNIIVGPRRPGAYWPKKKENYMSASATIHLKLSDEDMKDLVKSHETFMEHNLPKGDK